MNAKVKAIIERHEKDLGRIPGEKDNLENMIHDAIQENVLDEFLSTLREAGIILANYDIDKMVKEYERERVLIEANKAREKGLNNK
jgi:hypothetical protein